MKKNTIFKIILCFVILIAVGIGGAFKLYKDVLDSPFIKSEENVISINANKGTLSGVIAENESLFKCKIFLKIYNRINKISINVKKGVYEIPKDSSFEDVIKFLENGEYNTSIVSVTIPEGYTIEKIATLLDEKGIVDKEYFLKECKEYDTPSFINHNVDKRYTLEGYLFPDTYIFEKGMEPKTIIDIMINRFEDIIRQIASENNSIISEDDIDEIVIKASMIERETKSDKEKPLIASVINNRLDINMKLQIDATVLYAMGEHKDKLYLSDLKYESPYNTYYINGLPVGAISNPGKESLKAAIMPSSTDYLYYMTKDGLTHKFFDNYNDFIKYKKN